MSNNSLVNLGELSKPATVLIEKISKAVGTLYEPVHIVKVAEAEAKAAKIRAESEAEAAMIVEKSEIERLALRQRTIYRLITEETQRQKNMEDITAESLPHLNEDANPDAMEDDWVANFFDKCRIVSDGQMQSLWSRILAGEANTPGIYSKRTVNLVSELDKSEADLFTKLCGFGWVIVKFAPLVFDFTAEIYKKHGIDFDTLSHLESIGLVQFGELAVFKRLNVPQQVTVSYYGKILSLEMPKDTDNSLELGRVLLTKIGEEFAPICGSKPVDGFYEYVKDQWKEYLPAAEKP